MRAARGEGTAGGYGAAFARGTAHRQPTAGGAGFIQRRPSTGKAGEKKQGKWREVLHQTLMSVPCSDLQGIPAPDKPYRGVGVADATEPPYDPQNSEGLLPWSGSLPQPAAKLPWPGNC